MVIAQMVEGDAPGGTERLVMQIAQDLRRRGHRVVVIGPQEGPGKGWLANEMRAMGFEYDTVAKRAMADPRCVTDIVRLIRKHGIEMIHSHEFAPSVWGAIAAWLTRKTHVITMHSNLYFATARRRRLMFTWAVRHSAGVVAVSRDTGVDAERLMHLPAGSIHVIPNGIAFKPGQREPVRRELGLGDDDLLVVAIGNVSPRKDHILLVKALHALQQRRPEVRWHLAVAGNDQGSAPVIRQYAAEHGLESRVHLLGHRSDTENVLAASDVFAMSSQHEGMPLAIMEAMFAGKPVISTTAGGIAEMMDEGVDGMLTPVGDVAAMSTGLERLLTDASVRQRLGAAAIRRAERQFGVGAMMDAYLKLYRSGPTKFVD